MSVKRGDIYYADLSPVVGSEQGGLRPVLIIQNDIGNRYSPTVIAAAITSRLGKTRLPTHIDVYADRVGLVKNSVILLEQMRTLDKRRLKEKMGHLDEGTMEEVNRAIAVSVGLGDWQPASGGGDRPSILRHEESSPSPVSPAPRYRPVAEELPGDTPGYPPAAAVAPAAAQAATDGSAIATSYDGSEMPPIAIPPVTTPSSEPSSLPPGVEISPPLSPVSRPVPLEFPGKEPGQTEQPDVLPPPDPGTPSREILF